METSPSPSGWLSDLTSSLRFNVSLPSLGSTAEEVAALSTNITKESPFASLLECLVTECEATLCVMYGYNGARSPGLDGRLSSVLAFMGSVYAYPSDGRGWFEFLVSEVKGLRLCVAEGTLLDQETTKVSIESERLSQGSNLATSRAVARLADTLQVECAEGESGAALMSRIASAAREKVRDVQASEPLFLGHTIVAVPLDALSARQIETLRSINELLCQDFAQRWLMMMTRVAVTLQTFLWHDKLKDAMVARARVLALKSSISLPEPIDLYAAFSAKYDLAVQRKTSIDSVKSVAKSFQMGAVPDRGGRTNDKRQSKMPAFKPRVSGGGGGGGSGSGRKDGGGGDGSGSSNKSSGGSGGSGSPAGVTAGRGTAAAVNVVVNLTEAAQESRASASGSGGGEGGKKRQRSDHDENGGGDD